MTLKGTVQRCTLTALVLMILLLAAGVGKAAGPADTNWMTYKWYSERSALLVA